MCSCSFIRKRISSHHPVHPKPKSAYSDHRTISWFRVKRILKKLFPTRPTALRRRSGDKLQFGPAGFLTHQVGALQQVLARKGWNAALILQKTDLFYFAGTIQQATLYVPAAGVPVLMVNRSLERARAESPIDRIVAMSSLSQIPGILKQAGCALPETLGLELDVLPVEDAVGHRPIGHPSDGVGSLQGVALWTVRVWGVLQDWAQALPVDELVAVVDRDGSDRRNLPRNDPRHSFCNLRQRGFHRPQC